jgi:hypothetical protein
MFSILWNKGNLHLLYINQNYMHGDQVKMSSLSLKSTRVPSEALKVFGIYWQSWNIYFYPNRRKRRRYIYSSRAKI